MIVRRCEMWQPHHLSEMAKPRTKTGQVGNEPSKAHPPHSLAANFHEARIAAGFYVRDALADAIGVRPITLYRIEAGLTKRPEPETLEKLSKKLGVDESWLMHRVGKGPKKSVDPAEQLAKAFSEAVEHYLSSEEGRKTKPFTAQKLRELSWPSLGISEPRVKWIRRAREFIDANRLLAEDDADEEAEE